jgi:DNA-directed RNA polymerase beta' subunit
MNLHLPQSLGARAEASTIMKTANHIVSRQNNAAIMGCVQNTLLCMYIMTNIFDIDEEGKANTEQIEELIDISDFNDIVTWMDIDLCVYYDLAYRARKVYPKYIEKIEGGKYKFKSKVPGKLVASIVFPRDFTWSRETGTNDKYRVVKIVNGVILPDSGPMCKKVIGGAANTCVHIIWKMYGPDAAQIFISKLQIMAYIYLPRRGFSTGISDCISLKEEDVDKAVSEALIKCELINSTDKSDLEKEREMNNALNTAMTEAAKHIKGSMNKGSRNSLINMNRSGAKGSEINTNQIASFVGQQNIDGKRIPCTLNYGKRALSHFEEGDNSPEARGFVKNSFLKGLTPAEVWFHGVGGRRGIIDTAMKSVIGETPIYIDDKGTIDRHEIGKWIDSLISKYPQNNKIVGETETLDLPEGIKIPTTDSEGNISWSDVTAVTRHSPTELLYKIKTLSGREVTATSGKSFLVWKIDHFAQVYGDEIRKGDYLPTTFYLPLPSSPKDIVCNVISVLTYGFDVSTLTLDYDSGLFMGAYLSYGFCKDDNLIINADVSSIIFDKLGVKYKRFKGDNGFNGIVAHSKGLCDFLNDTFTVGKRLPTDILRANFDFTEGLINGYSDNSTLIVLPIYSHLRDGLLFMLSKLGLGTTIHNNDIYITEEYKNINDVLLDPIIEIETLPGNKHKYVYDLTVPSTTNFCLANGLHVVDTAESGYIEKRIGKKIEDCRAHFDGTIRDRSGILQFMYGGDGLNPKKLIYTKKLEFPFFIDVDLTADILNSRAQLSTKNKKELGAKRILEKEEVDLLLSYIQAGCPGVQTEVTERVTYNIRTILRYLLRDVKIYESIIVDFCGKIRDIFEDSKVDNGEMVGLIAEHSIGEPTTQLVLTTFHLAGVSSKDVTLGIPRLNEILNASKGNSKSGAKTTSKPSCTVYVDNETVTKRTKMIERLSNKTDDLSKEKSEKIDNENLYDVTNFAYSLQNITVSDIFVDHELQYLPNSQGDPREASPINLITYEEYEPKWWVGVYKNLSNLPQLAKPKSWVILLKLNVEKLYQYGLNVDYIAEKIEEEAKDSKSTPICCVPSPNNIGQIEVYINFSNVNDYMSTIDLPISEDNSLITNENIEFFIARDVVLEFIKKVKISGVSGISNVYIRKEESTYKDVKKKEWVIDTKGSNFRDVLNTPGVDFTRTLTDDLWEIYGVLGIFATRAFLMKEITKILSFDSTYINPKHMSILVDSMIRTGITTGVNRDGITRDVGPISKIMFEKPVDNVAESAVFCESDIMKSVASAVMCGTRAQVGTGVITIKDKDREPARRLVKE